MIFFSHPNRKSCLLRSLINILRHLFLGFVIHTLKFQSIHVIHILKLYNIKKQSNIYRAL